MLQVRLTNRIRINNNDFIAHEVHVKSDKNKTSVNNNQSAKRRSTMKLEAVDYTAENAEELFVESLRNTGFGVLKNHPIQQELVSSIYENWNAFFSTVTRKRTSILMSKPKMVSSLQKYLKLQRATPRRTLKSTSTITLGASARKH